MIEKNQSFEKISVLIILNPHSKKKREKAQIKSFIKVKNDTTEIKKDHKRLLPLIVFQENRQTREMSKFPKSVSLLIRVRK